MAAKNNHGEDVKKADKVLPSATSRPIVVTDHQPMAADPMVTAAEPDADASAEHVPVTRTAKVIQPLTPELSAPDAVDTPTDAASGKSKASDEAEEPVMTSSAVPQPAPSEVTDATANAAAAEAPEENQAVPEVPDEADAAAPSKRDTDAAVSAEEIAAAEARAAREQELEQLIESGKYAVPINAAQRKRSRLYTLLLFVLALLLAALLADAVLDAGLVSGPSSIPHTHFFQQ